MGYKVTEEITIDLARKLIEDQFPEFANLPIESVKVQGHDNRTFRLGSDMSVRMPTAEEYALKVPKEQQLLPILKPYLSVDIPVPLKMGHPSNEFPFPFSIYKWLDGESANNFGIDAHNTNQINLENISIDLARFLRELQNIDISRGPPPGEHNFWRGDNVSVYGEGARKQIRELEGIGLVKK